MSRMRRRTVPELVACIVLSALAPAGCASLSQSQIEEVGAFGKAAKAYTALPSASINGYVDVLRGRRTATTANRPIANELQAEAGWERIVSTGAMEREIRSLATQTDASLQIVQKYGQLLVNLTSDQFNKDFEKESKELGNQLDRAIETFNTINGRDDTNKIGPVGEAVTKAVTGIGKIWISHRQAKYIKAAVKAAGPAINEISIAVEGLLSEFAQPALTDGAVSIVEMAHQNKCQFDDSIKPRLCYDLDQIGIAVQGIAKREKGLDFIMPLTRRRSFRASPTHTSLRSLRLKQRASFRQPTQN